MSITLVKISNEEQFLIDVLFDKRQIDENVFSKINYEKLTVLCSSHLMLPSLYINIKKKKYEDKIPREFKNFLEDIFYLNKERNTTLLEEVKEISKILKENKIHHVFLKGTAHILSDMYFDIGERMINDIDILTNEEDGLKCFKTLIKYGYKESDGYHFFKDKRKHYVRQINKNKTFAVEVHKRLLINDLEKLKAEKVMNNKIIKKNIFVPSIQDQLNHNVYNFQINDYGNVKLSYSYRSIYDFYKLINSKKISKNQINEDKYSRNYYMILNLLRVFNVNTKGKKYFNLDCIRFVLKRRFKFFFVIDNFLTMQIVKMRWRPKQLLELFKNKEYRKYIFEKIIPKKN